MSEASMGMRNSPHRLPSSLESFVQLHLALKAHADSLSDSLSGNFSIKHFYIKNGLQQ